MELYPFQKVFPERFRDIRSVLNGDDMGTGKTAQAIALDLSRRELSKEFAEGKTLVVTPLAVIESWKTQLKKWAPQIRVKSIDPKNRDEDLIESIYLREADFYITHWQGLRLMPELQEVKWFHLILDECHNLQNRKSLMTKAAKAIPAIFKTGLSGTPAYAKPDDLWSILNWLYPSFWSSYWDYFDHHVLWTDYNGYKQVIGVANEEELQEQMKSFYIRRLKEDVVKDLPEKIFQKVTVKLLPKQERAYKQMRTNMLAWVGKNEDSPVNTSAVVAQLIRLQQFASAYAEIVIETKTKPAYRKWEVYLKESGKLVATTDNEERAKFLSEFTSLGELVYDVETILVPETESVEEVLRLAEPSSKIDAAIELLKNTDKQMVFFSQFSQLINLFCERLAKNKITYSKFTGETNSSDRARSVNKFKTGKSRVFAATVSAGGTGLDGLQVADIVVFFDRPWSQPVFEQAVARLHRIGQKNCCQVIDLIASDTLEEKRIENIELSWSWIKKLLGESGDD